MNDYFAVFELPRKLVVDPGELERRFYALSRQHHPDFHQLAGEAEQAAALEQSALVNRAYRALREPWRRVEHLLALEEGREPGKDELVKPQAPRALLTEMMEVQEALEEAKGSGLDEAAREQLGALRRGLLERRAGLDADLVARFPDWDRAVDAAADRTGHLGWFREALGTRAYLRTVIDDLGEALGEEEEADVAHRRH
jgi:molecular chaperone HscB